LGASEGDPKWTGGHSLIRLLPVLLIEIGDDNEQRTNRTKEL
jgi:hypothetical protein